MAASTSSGSVTDSSGTKTVPAPNRSRSRSPTATASRVLPTPPGPVSVTSRTSGRPSSPATSSMARSRPSSDVVLTGSRARARGPPGGGGACGRPLAAANRSLSSTARSSRTSRPSSAGVRKDDGRTPRPPLDSDEQIGQPGLAIRRRRLDVQQPGQLARTARTPPPGPRPSCLGPSCPYRCQYRPMNTSLCARYARYTSPGGYGRAPSSNITGVSRSAEMARETARRSSASSPSVELTNTRSRRSGVRITASSGCTTQVCNQPPRPATPRASTHF